MNITKKVIEQLKTLYPPGSYNILYAAPAIHRINTPMFETAFTYFEGWECTGGGDSGFQFEHEKFKLELSFETRGVSFHAEGSNPEYGIPTHIKVTKTSTEGRYRNPETVGRIPSTANGEQVLQFLRDLILNIVNEKLASVQWLVDYRDNLTTNWG